MKIHLLDDGSPHAEMAATLLSGLVSPLRTEAVDVMRVSTHEDCCAHGSPSVGLGLTGQSDVAAEILEGAGFPVRRKPRWDVSPPDVLEQAAAPGYDLVVCGAGCRHINHHPTTLSTNLLRECDTSMLVVHEFDGKRPIRILLGADGTDRSRAAVYALQSIVAPSACKIMVCSVAFIVVPAVYPVAPEQTAVGIDDVMDVLLEEVGTRDAQRYAQELTASLATAGFAAESHVGLGAPARVLLEEAVLGGFDLVVLGTRAPDHGHHFRLKRSISEQVATEAPACLAVRVR
jgi:nucleotide-binding universal stress UspA family protein